jgi:hypothetical protein
MLQRLKNCLTLNEGGMLCVKNTVRVVAGTLTRVGYASGRYPLSNYALLTLTTHLSSSHLLSKLQIDG